MSYLNGLVVFPTFFNLSLNLAVRSSWSEPQAAPGLVFADCIELLHLWLQRILSIWFQCWPSGDVHVHNLQCFSPFILSMYSKPTLKVQVSSIPILNGLQTHLHKNHCDTYFQWRYSASPTESNTIYLNLTYRQ